MITTTCTETWKEVVDNDMNDLHIKVNDVDGGIEEMKPVTVTPRAECEL